MEAIGSDPKDVSPRWVARLVEALHPLTARAYRLGALPLFEDFRWPELEAIAPLLEEVDVRRGTRLTVQGRRDDRLWLISDGEALVSADARPLRVLGRGEAAGVQGMLYSIASPETTTALGAMRALTAGTAEFARLVKLPRMRQRLIAAAGGRLRSGRLPKLR